MDLKLIRGIGEKYAKDFQKAGVTDSKQLVRYFPRGYLDMTNRLSVRDVLHNDSGLFLCRLVKVDAMRFAGKLKYFRAWLEQDGVTFSAVWFNMPYLAARLKPGEYLFYGRVQNKYGHQICLVNPSFESVWRSKNLRGMVPVYPLKGGLTQRVVRESIRTALTLEPIGTVIPKTLCEKYKLSSLREAFLGVHQPQSQRELSECSNRVALEEYFILISAFKLIKGDKNQVRSRKYTVTRREVAEFQKRFRFEFTEGQQNAVKEIYDNLTSPHCMNRLLQGDVGSGKTAVALTGIYMAVRSGFQAVYLSPTEVLAAQNYSVLKNVFPEYRVGYLSGGCTAKEKREIKEKLKKGEIDILCGTHAVLQGDVHFRELAFCVCDEQHRFGVSQRNALSEKGDSPDVLVMSATPIPRTLSLIFYGDLDITTIPDKPKARQEISTSIIPAYKYEDMLSYIARETKSGKQAYFVCPKIDEAEGEITSVTELFEELKGRLPTVRFALLHGRMKEKEKAQIMEDFKRKVYDCLVSTTVIEVGIDVPDATIMVIYNAERFGLSQLHQLRGRVGRGSEKSYCFLLTDSDSETARERLGILKTTSDGFALAEKDLELRGSGDFFGTRQSGRILKDIENLKYSTEMIFLAKKLSDEAFAQKLNLEEIKTSALEKFESLKDVVLN